jgi:hypothetical protein
MKILKTPIDWVWTDMEFIREKRADINKKRAKQFNLNNYS